MRLYMGGMRAAFSFFAKYILEVQDQRSFAGRIAGDSNMCAEL